MTRGKFQTAKGIQMSQKTEKKEQETGMIEPKALIFLLSSQVNYLILSNWRQAADIYTACQVYDRQY